ncbi:MAG: YraN family protein [Oscillospiraceae bacterium]
MEESKRLGILGEEAVAYEYRLRGGIIWDNNYSCRLGEIDIIAILNDFLIICEVKTRKENSLISGFEAVNRAKQQRIIAATKHFMAKNNLDNVTVRFDVAEVVHLGNYKFRVNILENAFSV